MVFNANFGAGSAGFLAAGGRYCGGGGGEGVIQHFLRGRTDPVRILGRNKAISEGFISHPAVTLKDFKVFFYIFLRGERRFGAPPCAPAMAV